MKTLLWIKRFDLAVQLCALCVPILLAISAGQYSGIYYAYFSVGGLQVVSFIVHALSGPLPWISDSRRKYGRLLGWTLSIGLGIIGLCFIWTEIVLPALGLGAVYLVVTPLMAILYFVICLREAERVAQLAQREMLIVRTV